MEITSEIIERKRSVRHILKYVLVIVTGIHKVEDVMNRHVGTSFLLAAIVTLGLGASAQAGEFNGTEEGLAVPAGSYNSAWVIPFNSENVSAIAKLENGESQPIAQLMRTEEDLAVPPGSYNSAWVLPNMRENTQRVATATARKNVE
jgi:hypothetical protein